MFRSRMFAYSTVLVSLLQASQWILCIKGSSSTSWLSQCTPEGLGELKQLYVSTIDGRITALSSTGVRQWRYKFSQPLYSSSLSYSEPSSQFPNLIPGLDKKLYRWDGIQLSPLAVSLEDMLSKDDGQPDVIRVGGKMKEDVALDVATGKPLYHCTHFGCQKYNNNSQIGGMDKLLISAHRTTVREAHSLTGEEIWNFTVSRLKLVLLEGEVSADQGDVSCLFNGESISDWIINVDASQGILYVSNNYSKSSWHYVFPAPIMDVWLHHGGKLEKVSLSPLHYPTETSPALLLGVWHDQYYIQPTIDRSVPLSSPFKPWGTRFIGGPSNYYGINHVDALLCNLDAYTPIFPSDHHGNKPIALYNHPENWLTELSTLGPNGLALYFHPLDSDNDHASCYSRELENTSDDQTIPTKSTTLELDHPGYISTALEYGRNVLHYAVFAMIVLVVNKIRRYHSQQRRLRKRLTSSSSSDSEEEVFRLSDDLGADQLIPPAFINTRRSSSSSTIKPSPTCDLLPILEEEHSQAEVGGSGAGSSFPSSISLPAHLSEIEPKSRFDTEYSFLGVLGKGGFGVVYHVKNRTDNIEYALKRIKLPEKPSAREKVMREVHALAQLDHPHIVRYFNSWVEKAPPGWDRREEWGVPLSRVNSLVRMDEFTSSTRPSHPTPDHTHSLSSHQLTKTTASIQSDCSESHTHSNEIHAHSNGSLTHSNGSIPLSSISSFSPELPPLRSTLTSSDSQSSFTIEFRDDSQSRLSSDDCSRPGSPISISIIGSSLSHQRQQSSLSSVDTSSSYDYGRVTSSNGESTNTDQTSQDVRPHPQLATPSFVFIQMQLCQKKSLRDWLKENVDNRLRVQVLDMFEQILNAVVYVHDKGLMHRDLKPSNIFFSLDGRIKVGDFGLVTGLVTPDAHNNSFNVLKHLDSQLESDISGRHTGNIGTHFYVSPEQMMGLKYDQKVDIFSLGVILFELNHPFTTEMERAKVLECLRKSKFPVNFKKLLNNEASFVEWLMSPVGRRPTALEVCNSTRLEELKKTINNTNNDLSVVPKL